MADCIDIERQDSRMILSDADGAVWVDLSIEGVISIGSDHPWAAAEMTLDVASGSASGLTLIIGSSLPEDRRVHDMPHVLILRAGDLSEISIYHHDFAVLQAFKTEISRIMPVILDRAPVDDTGDLAAGADTTVH